MSEKPVIGGEDTPAGGAEEQPEPVIGATDGEAPARDASEAELAEVLRETLLAAHDDLTPDDLPGESVTEVRERYVAARERLEREAQEAKVPAGAPGRFAPAPTSAFEKIREGLTRLNA
ncbi:MAG: hypothetical protein OXH12_07805 [Chloroflexi bacterium]|nr:hypothetical protein [Chloroflexota bacterium]